MKRSSGESDETTLRQHPDSKALILLRQLTTWNVGNAALAYQGMLYGANRIKSVASIGSFFWNGLGWVYFVKWDGMDLVYFFKIMVRYEHI